MDFNNRQNSYVIIITDVGLPNGFAPGNRIINYVKGFEYKGLSTDVLIFRPTNSHNIVTNKSKAGKLGESSQFEFTYTNTRSKYFVFRPLIDILSLIYLFLKLEKLIWKKGKPDFVIVYTYRFWPELFTLIQCKLHKILIYKEVSENPIIYTKRVNFFAYLRIYMYFILRSYSAILVMTNKLWEYFEKNGFDKLILVPMTVDISRFEIVTKKDYTSFKITYVGSLNEHKDGVLFLIRAISDLLKTKEIMFLQLVGDPFNDAFLTELNNLLSSSHITQKVLVSCKIESKKIPSIISNSQLLVLPRPLNLQTEYGFPTKLGEYLASGVPVLSSDVGEIPQYLQDGVNAFLYKSGDTRSLHNRLVYIMNNYQKAIEVGNNGRKTAEMFFDSNKNVLPILMNTKEEFNG